MNEEELRNLYNNDYSINLEFGEFCYNKGKAHAIDEVNKAEDMLIKCFKKENEIWTIRMAFAELREQLLKE